MKLDMDLNDVIKRNNELKQSVSRLNNNSDYLTNTLKNCSNYWNDSNTMPFINKVNSNNNAINSFSNEVMGALNNIDNNTSKLMSITGGNKVIFDESQLNSAISSCISLASSLSGIINFSAPSGYSVGSLQSELDSCKNILNNIANNIKQKSHSITSTINTFNNQPSIKGLVISNINMIASNIVANNNFVANDSNMSIKQLATSLINDRLKNHPIPKEEKQFTDYYVVTCYGRDGWWIYDKTTGRYNLCGVGEGLGQRKVHEAWKKDNARYKNGISVINTNGTDRYLVAVTLTFGFPGDKINVELENGTTVPCVIADVKNPNDSNYTAYGHKIETPTKSGVNILEFEVNKDSYIALGNITTNNWHLEWDNTSPVVEIKNLGSIFSEEYPQDNM